VVAAEVVVDVVFEQPARDMLTKAAAKRKANETIKDFFIDSHPFRILIPQLMVCFYILLMTCRLLLAPAPPQNVLKD
jgi:hypothetical protein